MNRLWTLPRGFGSFSGLELLDLTYNNLSEKSLPGNFFMLGLVTLFVDLALQKIMNMYRKSSCLVLGRQ